MSNSESDSESNRSLSPITQTATTPGRSIGQSRSQTPDFANKFQVESPGRTNSHVSQKSGSRSRSGTPASNRSHSGSRSRSVSLESNKSGSQKSLSVASNKSDHSRKSRSRSLVSNRSNASNKSRVSVRSESDKSVESNQSGTNRSVASKKSGSQFSHHSNKSGSPEYNRSPSETPKSIRSRSASVKSNRSGSHNSNHSRSPSAKSNKSIDGSQKSHSSRSNSAQSNRSRSGSVHSNRSGSSAASRTRSPPSRSRSISAGSKKSRSRSAESHHSRKSRSHSHSGSNSPHLRIDEDGILDHEEKDGGSEEREGIKKKTRVIDSDSDEDGGDRGVGGEGGERGEMKEVSAAAIFGDDADDISSEDERDKESDDKKNRIRSDEEDEEHQRSDDDNIQRPAIDDDEDKENEPEPIPETRIDVEIPKISCDLGRDIHFVKLPNFLSVETRPFDPETYEDEIDEEETLDEEGRARLKLKVENTIRWREIMDNDGNIKKESNARIIRWSDGSYSLHLGSEIFDVYKQPLQGDHNHLFIRQGTGLQGQAVFRTKLSFRPHSTESFTHRKMTLSLADRSQKTSGIKILSQVGVDPDHDRKNLLKKEEEKLRQTVKVTKPRKKEGTRQHNSSTTYSREEEGSDDEGAISLNAIKNKYKPGTAPPSKGGAIYSSDEEGSDIEARRARKLDKTKALKDSDTSEESE